MKNVPPIPILIRRPLNTIKNCQSMYQVSPLPIFFWFVCFTIIYKKRSFFFFSRGWSVLYLIFIIPYNFIINASIKLNAYLNPPFFQPPAITLCSENKNVTYAQLQPQQHLSWRNKRNVPRCEYKEPTTMVIIIINPERKRAPA